ncbi:MAG: aminoacyl-tRNA deacylase [Chloroflexota bacterium]|nr:MAG: aminoacyl-tRNA deacylase [Chloroflexota bacterium]
MSEKTLAMLVLEGQKVPYHANHYPSSLRDAEEIAHEIGVEPGRVFKTLVVTRPAGKPFLVMLAADRQLDLKRMAKAVGEKKVKMASQREAEKITGLQVGGISALALLNRGFAACLDSDARKFKRIHISAGKRGVQLEVPVDDLIRITSSRLMSVSR